MMLKMLAYGLAFIFAGALVLAFILITMTLVKQIGLLWFIFVVLWTTTVYLAAGLIIDFTKA